MYNDTSYYLSRTPVAIYPASGAVRQPPHHFKSLASMWSSLLASGLITLLLQLSRVSFSYGFPDAWMESWLISWLILFPLVYLLRAPLALLTASVAARRAGCDTDLSLAQIADASANATASNDLRVQHPSAVI